MQSSVQMVDGAQSSDGVIMVMPFTNAQYAQQAAKTMAARAGSAGMIWAVLDAAARGLCQSCQYSICQIE
jgi:signal recognition particle GTPase